MEQKIINDTKEIAKNILYGIGNIFGKSVDAIVRGFNDGRKGKDMRKKKEGKQK